MNFDNTLIYLLSHSFYLKLRIENYKMNKEKIMEAIKTNNLDLFRLLYDYRKIFDSVEDDDYIQLIRETKISYRYLTGEILDKNNIDSEIIKIVKKKDIQILKEDQENIIEFRFLFRFLFKPSEFLDTCVENKAYAICKDYIDSMSMFYSCYISDMDLMIQQSLGNSIIFTKDNVIDRRIKFLNKNNSFYNSFRCPILWNNDNL